MRFLLLCFFIASSSYAQIEDCYYDNDNFKVILVDRTLAYNVDDNYQDYLVDCNRKLAGFYDGDDFIIFDATTNKFERHNAEDNNKFAKLSSSRNQISLYDGDDFIIYNSLNSRFESFFAEDNADVQIKSNRNIVALYDGDDLMVYNIKTQKMNTRFVDDNSPYAKMSVSKNIVAFYDGDDLFVYDAESDAFDTKFVNDDSEFGALTAGNGIVLFYDGDDIHSYCNGSFSSIFAPNNQRAYVIGMNRRPNRSQHSVAIRINNEIYRISRDNCNIITSRI
jgi:hypothetical protein